MLDVTSFVAGIAATALIAVIVWRLFRRSIDATRQEALQLRREIEHRQTEADASLETMTDRIDRVERSLASLRFKLTAPVLHDPYPDSFSLGRTTLSRSIVGPPIDLPSDLAERPLDWKPRRPLAEHDTDQDKPRPYEEITVFYSTDRRPAGRRWHYGSERSTLRYGQCRVTVPTERQIGTIPLPGFLLRTIRVEVRRWHFTMDAVDEQSGAEFLSGLRTAIHGTPEKQALVFIHGFNVSFVDAVYRTAQIAVDLEFDGPAILYSWPSAGEFTPAAYAYDQEQAIWTLRHLRPFLEMLADDTGAERIHLLAHSMGNQALTSALLQLAPTLRRRPVFHELVLTAPDIDTDMFSNDIAPAILGVARRSTLYASSQDIALDFSRRLHGYPRAGDSGEEIVLVNGMDSIDVSAVSTDFLGHGYYGSNDSVLSDMHYLIKGLQISDRHGLRQQSRNAQPYWVFRP